MPHLHGVCLPTVVFFHDLDDLREARDTIDKAIERHEEAEDTSASPADNGPSCEDNGAAPAPNAMRESLQGAFAKQRLSPGLGFLPETQQFQPRFNVLTILGTIQKYGPLIQQFAQMLGELAQAANPPASNTTKAFTGSPGGIPHA